LTLMARLGCGKSPLTNLQTEGLDHNSLPPVYEMINNIKNTSIEGIVDYTSFFSKEDQILLMSNISEMLSTEYRADIDIGSICKSYVENHRHKYGGGGAQNQGRRSSIFITEEELNSGRDQLDLNVPNNHQLQYSTEVPDECMKALKLYNTARNTAKNAPFKASPLNTLLSLSWDLFYHSRKIMEAVHASNLEFIEFTFGKFLGWIQSHDSSSTHESIQLMALLHSLIFSERPGENPEEIDIKIGDITAKLTRMIQEIAVDVSGQSSVDEKSWKSAFNSVLMRLGILAMLRLVNNLYVLKKDKLSHKPLLHTLKLITTCINTLTTQGFNGLSLCDINLRQSLFVALLYSMNTYTCCAPLDQDILQLMNGIVGDQIIKQGMSEGLRFAKNAVYYFPMIWRVAILNCETPKIDVKDLPSWTDGELRLFLKKLPQNANGNNDKRSELINHALLRKVLKRMHLRFCQGYSSQFFHGADGNVNWIPADIKYSRTILRLFDAILSTVALLDALGGIDCRLALYDYDDQSIEFKSLYYSYCDALNNSVIDLKRDCGMAQSPDLIGLKLLESFTPIRNESRETLEAHFRGVIWSLGITSPTLLAIYLRDIGYVDPNASPVKKYLLRRIDHLMNKGLKFNDHWTYTTAHQELVKKAKLSTKFEFPSIPAGPINKNDLLNSAYPYWNIVELIPLLKNDISIETIDKDLMDRFESKTEMMCLRAMEDSISTGWWSNSIKKTLSNPTVDSQDEEMSSLKPLTLSSLDLRRSLESMHGLIYQISQKLSFKDGDKSMHWWDSDLSSNIAQLMSSTSSII